MVNVDYGRCEKLNPNSSQYLKCPISHLIDYNKVVCRLDYTSEILGDKYFGARIT